jgi:hypothetical protein
VYGALEQAYRQAHYRVQAGTSRLTFRIDQYDPRMESLLAQYSGEFRDWVILTPCNPRSAALCEHENRARLDNLRIKLAALPYRWLASSNHDPAGSWPDEPGALILDMPIADACVLGMEFDQNAFVHASRGRAPQLHWLE